MSMPEALLVFDSGFGGLSIVAALRSRGFAAPIVYAADHAGFPYGALDDAALIARTCATVEAAAAQCRPGAIVVACSSASTLALPALRARWAESVVGVVPAIKPAAALTRTGLVSVLATPGTVRRPYTQKLIDDFAGEATVSLIAVPGLPPIAEAMIAGAPPDLAAIRAEIAPAFVDKGDRRTDVIALACTHFPLLIDALEAAAPWPVSWVDPAEAVARRVIAVAPALAAAREGEGVFCSTAPPSLTPTLRSRLAALGLAPRSEPLQVDFSTRAEV